MINDSSRYVAAVAGRTLSLAVRVEAPADEIDARKRFEGARVELREEFA
jgi:hypothetical protein